MNKSNFESIPLRTIAAIMIKPNGEHYSHQQISNRYKPEGQSTIPFSGVTGIINTEEAEMLKCIALRRKRTDYVYNHMLQYGFYPSDEEIKKITLENEVNNEIFE